MPLSIKKFDRFLEKHGIITSLFYIDEDSYCRMIEVYSTATDETFMIYISSSCQMTIGTGSNVFRIQELEYNEIGDIMDRYSDDKSRSERGLSHSMVILKDDKGDIESRMQDMYRKQVHLRKGDRQTIEKDVFRQISRLTSCVSHMKFKVCIQTPDLIYFTDPVSDVIRIFSVTDNLVKRVKSMRRLNVIVDIETLFDASESISKNVKIIKQQLVENITENITRNISSSKVAREVSDKWTSGISKKLAEYKERIENVREQIDKVCNQERSEIERKIALENKTEGSITMFTLNKNLEFVNQLALTNKKLLDISETKRELYLNMASLIVKHDNLILAADSTVFDIVVLTDTIHKKIELMLKL